MRGNRNRCHAQKHGCGDIITTLLLIKINISPNFSIIMLYCYYSFLIPKLFPRKQEKSGSSKVNWLLNCRFFVRKFIY